MGNDNYIDTVVLAEKPVSGEATSGEAAHDYAVAGKSKAPDVNDVRLTRVGALEVSSLTIDETHEGGGDPYNSTGKHCILKIKE